MTELQRERFYPWMCGIVCTGGLLIAHYALDMKMPSGDGYKSALLTLGGIFSGFMATLNALLFSMSNESFTRLRESEYLKDLLVYLNEALWSSLVLCFFTWIAFWVPEKYWQLEALLGGLTVFSIVAIFRVSRVATSLLATRN
ncbi:hypothetical protein [Rhodanobacter sp. A1T4]|uniref:hypothetical protein n=1 Tax=Rhodanobacter sp. A1T4 TaxID=2723087 RepID=UPI00161D93EF|nr:hypothetical protein [Rhodanobacter sp. A1T4]MBB6245693.1 hypothetical protein [Rhodanobacter sp. A1T4]